MLTVSVICGPLLVHYVPCVSGSAVICCTVMCVLLYYEQINRDGDIK